MEVSLVKTRLNRIFRTSVADADPDPAFDFVMDPGPIFHFTADPGTVRILLLIEVM
jgi:hypothetical protein